MSRHKVAKEPRLRIVNHESWLYWVLAARLSGLWPWPSYRSESSLLHGGGNHEPLYRTNSDVILQDRRFYDCYYTSVSYKAFQENSWLHLLHKSLQLNLIGENEELELPEHNKILRRAKCRSGLISQWFLMSSAHRAPHTSVPEWRRPGFPLLWLGGTLSCSPKPIDSHVLHLLLMVTLRSLLCTQ